MSNYLLLLPDDIFKYHLLQYLELKGIVQLDNAIINCYDRNKFLLKLANTILSHDNISLILTKLLLTWLFQRRIYLTNDIKITGQLNEKDLSNCCIETKEYFQYITKIIITKNCNPTHINLLTVFQFFQRLTEIDLQSKSFSDANIVWLAIHNNQLQSFTGSSLIAILSIIYTYI